MCYIDVYSMFVVNLFSMMSVTCYVGDTPVPMQWIRRQHRLGLAGLLGILQFIKIEHGVGCDDFYPELSQSSLMDESSYCCEKRG